MNKVNKFMNFAMSMTAAIVFANGLLYMIGKSRPVETHDIAGLLLFTGLLYFKITI